jgi:hypothetical protein
MTKAAVNGFHDCLRAEMEPFGVQVSTQAVARRCVVMLSRWEMKLLSLSGPSTLGVAGAHACLASYMEAPNKTRKTF